ncbi:hypothetical protein BgAZ_304820 [Babesia gibsoni]|uniref:Uncharacterized protein n=1 Tax=Babesia gibsoni TaxID=33632 RepID=A0AAD8LIS1_BABGI|nr:hypothetical protein BgAZ_304820 [Babesia gibsoni]
MKQLKGARKYHRNRPKKLTPAKVYASPTLYYGNIQDYFGAPREYYAIPCTDAINVMNGESMVKLIGMIKCGITGEELAQEFDSNSNFHSQLLNDLQRLRNIATSQNCDVTRDLVIYFDRVINQPKENPHFVDRGHSLKKLQDFWRRREFARYRGLFKHIFWRMREIAAKVAYAGVTLEDFKDPKLWWRYGVFKGLPKSTMASNYVEKHKIALNNDIRDFYFIDADTQEVRCMLDENVDNCRRKPIEKLDKKVIERMSDDLKQLGIFPNDEWQTMNMSRIDELQRECSSEDSHRAYAIRDFYLTHLYPEYKVNGDPYYLESFVNHKYRTKTLERDLGEKYANWVRSGARRPMPRPINPKYKQLVIWKSLSRNKRRRLIQEFLYPRADTQTVQSE